MSCLIFDLVLRSTLELEGPRHMFQFRKDGPQFEKEPPTNEYYIMTFELKVRLVYFFISIHLPQQRYLIKGLEFNLSVCPTP